MISSSGRFRHRHSGGGIGGKPFGEHNHRTPLRRSKINTYNGTDKNHSPTPAASATKIPKMNEYTSIEKMVQVAFDNFLNPNPSADNCGQLRDIAACWSHASKILADDHIGKVNEKQQTLLQLKALRNQTVKYIELFEPADFSKSFVALAKIFSSTKKNGSHKRDDVAIFRSFLLDVKGNPCENPFQFFLFAAIPLLPRLSHRDLSCVSYAYSLISESEGKSLKDGPLFLDTIALDVVSRVNARRYRQTTQDSDNFCRSLSRILFDFAKSGQSHALLFRVAEKYLCEELSFHQCSPSELANISFSFSKTNEPSSTIFQKIASAIIAQYTSGTRLAWFKPSDLCTIICSFERVGELVAAPDEFKRKMNNALFAKLCRQSPHETFSLEELSDIIWALSKSSLKQPTLFTKIGARINLEMQTSHFQPRSLATFVWTCCESNVHIEELFHQESIFMSACLEQANNFSDEDLHKLYRFHLWQQQRYNCGLPSFLYDKSLEAHFLPSNLLSEND